MADRTDAPASRRTARPAGRWITLVAAGFATVAIAAPVVMIVTDADDAELPAPGSIPRFADVTADSGLDHVYDGEFEHFVGGGVAVLDCDADGRPDLYLAGGTNAAALYRNVSDPGGPPRFEVVTSPTTGLDAVTGAFPLDLDSDGVTDLMVLRRGENVLLRGVGACAFEEANDEFALDGGDDWTTAFSATWEPGNSLPTLAFGNYLTLDRDHCADSVLVRPDGERYGAGVPLTPGYCTLSALFSDWNRTGRRDLRLTNDRHYYREGSEQLWQVEPDTTPRSYTADDGWRPLQIWGMGIASTDVTGDGLPEVFLTSQGDNKLQTLAGDPAQPAYDDIALRSGATAHRPYTGDDIMPSTAWHPEFDDVNNDGLVDLFVTKGNVEAQTDHAMEDPNNLLVAQPDGVFLEGGMEAGVADFTTSRGAAVVDLDLDGLLDLVVVNRRENVDVWHNLGAGEEEPQPAGNWFALRLRQPPPNVEAIGAWVEVSLGDDVTSREIVVGGGHGGGELGWVHFGLGSAEGAEVRVTWPDGEIGPWMEVGAGERVILHRDALEPQRWEPPTP